MAANTLEPISSASSTPGTYNVLGLAVDVLPIFRTRGSSKCITFTIKDCDFDLPAWDGGLKVKYFNDDESALPGVQVNDIVFLRNIRTTFYQRRPIGVVSQNQTVPWIIFRPESNPSSSPFILTGPAPFEPSLWERDQGQSLLDRLSGGRSNVQQPVSRTLPAPEQTTHVQASRPTPSKGGGLPFSLVKDAEANRLYQLIGQVVKLKTYDSEKTMLYMTDYTENQHVLGYDKPEDGYDEGTGGDQFNYLNRTSEKWPGPWGKYIIPVNLFYPHAPYANENIESGDVVLLTYAQAAFKRDRPLEVYVRGDRKWPERVHIHILRDSNDERVQALMARRTEYWKIHGEPKKDNKKAKKQAKKAQAKQSKAPKEQGQMTLRPPSAKTNVNVKVKEYTAPYCPLEKVLLAESHKNHGPGGVVYQLPFQNVTYRSIVRVIDFFPPNLEDFAVQTLHAPLHTDLDDTAEPRSGWQWRFCLLVEGIGPKQVGQQRRETMKLYVTGSDGEFLLDAQADSLRSDNRLLSAIKEKLFLLWGNLEEQKTKALASGESLGRVSSIPFECHIKEYGVPCTHAKESDAMDVDGEICSQADCFGWERRFAIFDTTIHG